MARKPLIHPCDSSARKNPERHKEHAKPLIDQDGKRVIGKAFDRGIIKEEA